MQTVLLKVLDHFDKELPFPSYATKGSSGLDVRACFHDKKALTLFPLERVAIPTGLCFEIPEGHEFQVRARSGLAFKQGLIVPNAPGTIDADYRGELKILLANISSDSQIIEHGQRIAQIVMAQVISVKFQELHGELSSTQRSDKGFGSTGLT